LRVYTNFFVILQSVAEETKVVLKLNKKFGDIAQHWSKHTIWICGELRRKRSEKFRKILT